MQFLLGCLALTVCSLCLAAWFIIARLRTEKHKIVLSHKSIQSESDLLRTRLEIQEHALNTIYHEIHENIGQMLSCVHMKLITLGFTTENKMESGKLSELATYMGRSIVDLRNLGHAFNGSALEKTGLIDAVEKEIVFASSVYNLQCIFTCEDELPELTAVQDTVLFRIIQGMTGYMFNLCKGSSSVHLRIACCQDGRFSVHISDSEPTLNLPTNLYNQLPESVSERIKLMKGNLFMTNQTTGGMQLTFTCNLNYDHSTKNQYSHC